MLNRLNLLFDYFRTLYVACQDSIRLYSAATGELIRELNDNRDGQIVGFNIEPEKKKSLIACTSNGNIITWKLDTYLITNRVVSWIIVTFVVIHSNHHLYPICRNSPVYLQKSLASS